MVLDFSILSPYMHMFSKGAVITIQASICGILLGTILGIIVGACRVLPFKPLRWLMAAYIYVLRGTPLMVQLFLIYFGLPAFGINLTAFISGVIGIGVNSSGYVGEIVRGGIEAIPKGQWEAAKMLGLSHGQTMRIIVLPQAIRQMLPALGNEFVTLIKESSLLSVLAINELTMVGQQVRSVTYASFETFIFVAFVYLIMTSLTSGALQLIENKWHVK